MRRSAAVLPLLLGLAACAAPPPEAPSGSRAKVVQEGEILEVDRLKLAAVMVRDGHYDRAEAELSQVDERAEGLDLPRYHTLRGLVALNAQKHEMARDQFLAAQRAGQREPVVHVYLAQAQYALRAYRETVEALDRAGEAAAGFASLHAMRIQCLWRLKEAAAAFGAISDAERRFPESADFTRQRVFYLLDLGLNKEAADAGRGFLARAGETRDAYLALGEALRRARRFDEALEVLELGRLRHPFEEQLLLSLAHAWLEKGAARSAGVVLEEAAASNPKYLAEAAELHRRGGDLRRALWINSGLEDQKVKSRQRLGLLLEAERFDEALSLEDRLRRLDLFADEDVRYAFAVLSFRTGDFDRAEEHLRGLTRPDLFQAAAELRKAIEASKEGASQRSP
jgi:tetratricopeptide (TPR) repeat protein